VWSLKIAKSRNFNLEPDPLPQEKQPKFPEAWYRVPHFHFMHNNVGVPPLLSYPILSGKEAEEEGGEGWHQRQCRANRR
jgi:hypothetical protein